MAVKVGALSAATVYGRTDEGSTALYETVRAIKAIPYAQPEIIRCKDCENYQTDWKPQDSDGHYCAVMDRVMEDDGFCSYAERRQDE